MTKKKLDWLDADIVQPPFEKGKIISELVMLRFDDKNETPGCAVYSGLNFLGWSTDNKVVEWAYYK